MSRRSQDKNGLRPRISKDCPQINPNFIKIKPRWSNRSCPKIYPPNDSYIMLTQNDTGPVGPVTPSIYWSCRIFTGPAFFL